MAERVAAAKEENANGDECGCDFVGRHLVIYLF